MAKNHLYRSFQIAVLSLAITAVSNSVLADDNELPLDLIDDAPGIADTAINSFSWAFNWVWDTVGTGLSYVMPPTPQSVSRSMGENEKSELFRLLDIAGYKPKAVKTELGLIPYLSFKFGMVRELSDADLDYLEYHLVESRQSRTDWTGRLQRGIVETVVSINADREYVVSELEVNLLPLPSMALKIVPAQAAFSEETSALLNALNQLDRDLNSLLRVTIVQ